MQFKNRKSGNVITVTNAKAIELIKKSDNYVEVTKKAARAAKEPAKK